MSVRYEYKLHKHVRGPQLGKSRNVLTDEPLSYVEMNFLEINLLKQVESCRCSAGLEEDR